MAPITRAYACPPMPLRAFFSNRDHWALTGLVLMAILLPISFGKSEAAYVANSNNPGSVFSSASSFNTVAVTLTNPGTPLRGTVILNAVATSDRGMGTVAFQSSPAGANTWTTACTDNSSPFSCSLDTTGLADGLYDIRAVATDNAGYTQTSTVTNRRIDNTAPTATTTDPGSPLTGTVSVSGNGTDLGSGVASATVQYRPSGGGSWTSICTQASAGVTCAWNTASLADGLYDLRTIATDVAGNTTVTSTVVANRRLDNIAPSATMTAPAANLTGSVTLASTSSDAANGTGVASVRYEYKPSAGSTWSTACTSATTPFSCSFNTTAATDGLYDFRAVAIDGVNLTGASAAVTSRRIDNTAPTATMGALAANLSGSVSLTSTLADSGTGVASAQYQYKLTSDSTLDQRLLVLDDAVLLLVQHRLGDRRPLRLPRRRDRQRRQLGRLDRGVLAPDRQHQPDRHDGLGARVGGRDDRAHLDAGRRRRHRLRPVPVQAQLERNLAQRLLVLDVAVLLLVQHGGADQRQPLRLPRGRHRQRRPHRHLRHRHEPHGPRQPDGDDDRARGGHRRVGDAGLDAGRRRQRRRLGAVPVQAQRGLDLDRRVLVLVHAVDVLVRHRRVADGLYDFRVIATDNVGRTATSTASTNRRIDNTNPAR